MGTFCAKGHGSVSFTIYHHPDKFQASLSWHWWLRMIWPCFLFPASPHSPPTWTLYPSATEPPAGTQAGPAFCQLLWAFVPQYLLSQGCPSWHFFLLFNSSLSFQMQFGGSLPDSSKGGHLSCLSTLPAMPPSWHFLDHSAPKGFPILSFFIPEPCLTPL